MDGTSADQEPSQGEIIVKPTFEKHTADGASFTWNKKVGTTRASQIGWDGRHWPNVVYVRSPRTGEEVGFIYASSPTGDCAGFQYISVKPRGIKLVITTG